MEFQSLYLNKKEHKNIGGVYDSSLIFSFFGLYSSKKYWCAVQDCGRLFSNPFYSLDFGNDSISINSFVFAVVLNQYNYSSLILAEPY